MSAHRTLNDMYRAFMSNNGPGLLADPGDAGTITIQYWGQICEMTSAAAETRTVARPNRSGVRFTLRLYTDGGNVTVTFTGGVNAAGDSVAVFADAGDFMELISVQASATTYRWQVLPGTAVVPTVELASTSPSTSPSSSPSASPSSSPSSSPSASPSSSPSAT